MRERDAFFNQLKDYLLSQTLRPGAQIEPETVLAERFGVSRYKVRRTMDAFAHMGIVERTPRRGTVVRRFDSRVLSQNIRFQFDAAQFNIAEFTEARAVVECAVLPLTIKRILPSVIAELELIIKHMEENADQPEIADKYDLEFHRQLFESSGNAVLAAFSSVLTMLFNNVDYRRQFWDPDYFRRVVIVEHRAILESIKSGDANKAVRQMRRHLSVVMLVNRESKAAVGQGVDHGSSADLDQMEGSPDYRQNSQDVS
jgi:DNA-binding FadR family transcriptional regulator